MKRGWLGIIIGLFLALTLSTTALDLNKESFDGCWGTNLCGDNFTCGYFDQLCVNDFFTPTLSNFCNLNYPDEGYKKCIDSDCSPDTCFYGFVLNLEGSPVSGATVSYSQDVWNGTNKITLTKQVVTSGDGKYNITAWPGNDINLLASAQSYSYDTYIWWDITEGCHEHNFVLGSGTCQEDCTKIGSLFCFADCEGEGTATDNCTFNHNTTFWTGTQTIPITEPFYACTQIGMRKGSYAELGSYEENDLRWCVRAQCCEGNPYAVLCPYVYINSDIEDAVKVTRLAKLKGQAIKLRIYYWE